MSRYEGPSRRDPALSGLEIWATGTRTELSALVGVLAAASRLAQQGQPRPLTGADTGRYRLYLRLTVATGRTGQARPPAPTGGTAGGALLDLDAVRADRRPA
ncbi:hypothetical protein V6U90_33270 [Micromonospora sp. CPCC 206060]|uniref:hypothetical protein n=1 Tax=Micromonospora sp. CPCC 206060 TaxID=3122406 RepID=UPI002FF3A1E4